MTRSEQEYIRLEQENALLKEQLESARLRLQVKALEKEISILKQDNGNLHFRVKQLNGKVWELLKKVASL